MSWQSYVDDHLLCELPKGGVLTAAAIVGQDGGVWAQNDAFPNIEQAEVGLSLFVLGKGCSYTVHYSAEECPAPGSQDELHTAYCCHKASQGAVG